MTKKPRKGRTLQAAMAEALNELPHGYVFSGHEQRDRALRYLDATAMLKSLRKQGFRLVSDLK